jgi:hypothetical protein
MRFSTVVFIALIFSTFVFSQTILDDYSFENQTSETVGLPWENYSGGGTEISSIVEDAGNAYSGNKNILGTFGATATGWADYVSQWAFGLTPGAEYEASVMVKFLQPETTDTLTIGFWTWNQAKNEWTGSEVSLTDSTWQKLSFIVVGDDDPNTWFKFYVNAQRVNNPDVAKDLMVRIDEFYVVEKQVITGIIDKKSALQPEAYNLNQNYPNPFNPSTTITFEIPKREMVKLSIFDLTGREVRSFVNGTLNAGLHQLIWDGTDFFGNSVASGIYLYQLKSENYVQTRKLMLIR